MLRRRYSILFLVVLLCLATVIWHTVLTQEVGKTLTVTFLDVGQGDAIFLTTPSGRQILIDGGKSSQVLLELRRVMPLGDFSIDMVVATHPDADHIGGLVPILRRYDVGVLVRSGSAHETEITRALEQARVNNDVTELLARRGQVFDFGDGVQVRVLFPDRDVAGLQANDASVVLQIVFGEHSFLLTGDSPSKIEEYLVSLDGSLLASDVLKAGHHGSRTSSAAAFVGFVDPQYVVFSRGCDNGYGHPHQDVIDVFALFEVLVRDTCLDGRVEFVTDGTVLKVK